MFRNLIRTISSKSKFAKTTRSLLLNLRTNSQIQNRADLEIHTKIKTSPSEASKFLNKGSEWLDINQSKAKDFFIQAIVNTQNLKIGANEIIARASYELSQIYLDERNLSQAHYYLKEALKNARESTEEMSELIGDVYYSLGLMMLTKGKTAAAQKYLESFLQETKRSGAFEQEKVAMAELELGKLLLETEDVEIGKERVTSALEYFSSEETFVVGKKAECYQVLGDYFQKIGDYDSMLEKNLECLTLLREHRSEIENCDELRFLLLVSFTEAGSSLNKLGSHGDTDKTISYLENALELFYECDEETRMESSGVLAKILSNAVSVLSRRQDKQQCNRIIEKIEDEDFTIENFESAEEYRDFILTFTGALKNLKMYQQGYQLLKETLVKYFESSTVDKMTRTEFYFLSNKFAFENGKYQETLSSQQKLEEIYSKQTSLSNSTLEQLFSASTNSLKSCVKLFKEEQLLETEWQSLFAKWSQLAQTVQNQVLIDSVQDIFHTLIIQSQHKIAESFLTNLLSFSSFKTNEDHQKLIFTYFTILYSRASNFSQAIDFSQKVKTGFFENLMSVFSKSSSTLFDKVTKNSTLIKECSETLHQMQANSSALDVQTLSSLWNLCHQYIKKSDLQTSLLLLDEIQRLIKGGFEGSTDFQGNIQILQILIGLEMGELEWTAGLLKEIIEGKELSCRKEFVTLVYLLYGDVLKDMNSSEEAMLMWMKAVDTYLRMRAHQSKDLATKNANLFENLLSKRSDLLPERYRLTIERNFKC